MKTTIVSLALAATALASPIQTCISDREANKFMGRFINVLEHVDSDLGDYLTTAQKLLTTDFQEISDSINMLAGKPLGGVTNDKTSYIAGAQHAPPTTGIESLAVTVSNCNNIIWEWNMNGVGMATYPVKGIGMFKMVRQGRSGLKVLAQELKLEFNSIAWGLDTGYGWVKQDGTLLGRAPNPTDPAPTTSDPTTGDAPADGSSDPASGSSTDGSSSETSANSTDGTSSETPATGSASDGTSTTDSTGTNDTTAPASDGQTSTTDSTGTDKTTTTTSSDETPA